MNKSISEVVHESAKDLYNIGLLSKEEMDEFDELCLSSNKKTRHQEVKTLQLREKLNQPIITKPTKKIRAAQR